MICGSHVPQFALNENAGQVLSSVYVVETQHETAQKDAMISEEEMKAALKAKVDAREIDQNDIAAVLKVSPAGVTRLFNDENRRIKLDEAIALAAKFNIGRPAVTPLSVPVSKLLILYAADQLGIDLSPDDPRVSELAQDFRAFSKFATDPRVRENSDAAAGFFQGLRLARDPSN